MTREEAIRKLKRELEAIEGDLLFKEFAEALDMAIEALSAEAVQVNCDLISRQDAIDSWDKLSKRGRTEFDQVLMTLPSAGIQVTRCKDCKWYLQKQKNLPYNVTKRYCNRTCTLATKEDDYCSYGERRLSSE